MTATAAPTELASRLVDGIQVLSKEDVLDGSGHLSARIPGTDTFLINPRYAGVLADPEDICTVDLSGKRLAGRDPIPIESVIHAAIYRARPDVGSVLHCHARYGILVGLQETGLVPFNREAKLFEDGVPVFADSRGITNNKMADELAETLGPHWAVFLRGHGIVVCGPNVEANCVCAIRFERSCRDQLTLMSFTTPRPLPSRGSSTGLSGPRMENPYRAWPHLLYKHGIRSRAEAKAQAQSGSAKTVREGEDAE
jgi:ribulose-5-phosphate 4-epimerase/fuculose-1-phosphate aldolase